MALLYEMLWKTHINKLELCDYLIAIVLSLKIDFKSERFFSVPDSLAQLPRKKQKTSILFSREKKFTFEIVRKCQK